MGTFTVVSVLLGSDEEQLTHTAIYSCLIGGCFVFDKMPNELLGIAEHEAAPRTFP